MSRCQSQQALVSPSPRYFWMTLAQTAPHPLLLSQSYNPQRASSTGAIRKAVPKDVPTWWAAMLGAAPQATETSPGLGDTSSPGQGTSPKPSGLLGGSEGTGRREMTEAAALLGAAVCTAGVFTRDGDGYSTLASKRSPTSRPWPCRQPRLWTDKWHSPPRPHCPMALLDVTSPARF